MKKTKIVALLLSVLLALSLFPTYVFASGDGYLSELAFGTATSAANKGNLSFDKAFNGDVYDYTLYVKDGQTSLSVWATLSTAGNGKEIVCKYTRTNGKDSEVKITSAKAAGASLAMVLGKNYDGNKLTVEVGEQKYNINIVRTSSLSSISVNIGKMNINLNKSFSASVTEYTASVPYGAKPTVSAAPTTAEGTVVSVGGKESGSVQELSWDESKREAVLEITVYKQDNESITKTVYKITFTAPEISGFQGSGTSEDPFLIKSGEDMKTLSDAVAAGTTFKGFCFRLENDITLPAGWAPIGTKTAKFFFAGEFNGAGHLITIPKGEKAPFGVTVEAYLHDFDIYGEEINGSAVVDIYTTGASNKTYVIIENVNLKSGTKTLKAGYIGGYSSGSTPIYISDCTVEKGVIIGYDKSQKWVGSFGGEYNGFIKNCVSYADVYGTDFVGGIIADKGQTMGSFEIENCKFYGNVEATGNYAGGICGAGYGGTNFGMASAPNSPAVTIKNCFADGNVKGNNYVGGILGGEGAVYQCWENGIGEISGNCFRGKLTAAGENAYIGGIIGFYGGLDKYTIINDNTYAEDCGAQKGIGFVAWVDTDYADHETSSGANYLNSGDRDTPLPDIKFGTGRWDPKVFTKRDLNRNDDPLGVDAQKLSRAVESDSAIAKAVDEKIKALGTITLSSKSAIEEIFSLYNALTEKQKALVTKKAELDSAKAAYEELAAAQGSGSGEQNANPASGSQTEKSPKTGNDGYVRIYLILMLAALAASCSAFKKLKATEIK